MNFLGHFDLSFQFGEELVSNLKIVVGKPPVITCKVHHVRVIANCENSLDVSVPDLKSCDIGA
jgi:hypothetical protein